MSHLWVQVFLRQFKSELVRRLEGLVFEKKVILYIYIYIEREREGRERARGRT
jgi:hypothetical protein